MEKGIHNIYKPVGVTSHDVVDEIRHIFKERRVGHAGTLDPLADGVLVIGIGREATKTLNTELAKEKEYIADIILGVTSTTDDEEGEKISYNSPKIPDVALIQHKISGFIGEIQQIPPAFSAIKINGKRSYEVARKGREVVLMPRMVLVKSIEIISYQWPKLIIRVVCGPGVYIRSLARDIGASLDCGGYIHRLRRTRVGEHRIEQSQCPYHSLQIECSDKNSGAI